MDYICTWLCADKKGEESAFPQTGELSSSQKHQNIYWRCVLVFFITSTRFNKKEKHVLFTNVSELPIIDGKSIAKTLNDLDVEIVTTNFNYKTPKDYYKTFQNQFFEFSILEYINDNNKNLLDSYLILDSDCVFIKPVKELFEVSKEQGFISFADGGQPEDVINGLNRYNLKSIYEELLNKEIDEIPLYHWGEFFLSNVKNINKIFSDFKSLWPILLERNQKGLMKFNEEAHTLSYLYFKNGLKPCDNPFFMRRIWTNPVFNRDVQSSDVHLCIWHLPGEKIFGINILYQTFFIDIENYGSKVNDDQFIEIIQKAVSIPNMSINMKIKYFSVSYSKALKKRIKKVPILNKILTAN